MDSVAVNVSEECNIILPNPFLFNLPVKKARKTKQA